MSLKDRVHAQTGEKSENRNKVADAPVKKVRSQEEIDAILAAHDANQQAQTHVAHVTQETIADAVEDNMHLYAATHSESFKIQLDSGEVQAKDGLLTLNKYQHKELQKLIKGPPSRPDIAQNLVYIDKKAAEEVARKHMQEMALRPAANRGSTHSGANSERGGSFIEVKPVKIPGASDQMNNQIGGEGARILQVEESDIQHADDRGLTPLEVLSTLGPGGSQGPARE